MSSSESPFISVRSALVALIALLVGGIVGGLTLLAVQNVAGAVLAGIVTTGGCIREGNKLIG